MQGYLLSVITVNLNNLQGLKQTIASVSEQTWQDFEFLVIDGGSTDGSKEFLKNHSKNLDYWVSEADSGVYNAMNKGIKMANGKYLFFLNSGDIFDNDMVLNTVRKHLNGCDVLYGNMLKVYPGGKVVEDKGVMGREISLKTFIDGNLNHQATFISKSLFDQYGYYDENLKIVSDWKFFLKALGLNSSKVSYIDIVISRYDMTGLSSDFKARDKERLKVIKELVPAPIYKDYIMLKKSQKILRDFRLKKFLQTDKKGISRKLHSLIFRLFH